MLEYDAARKIAQGLGAHLENSTILVEVKGDTARFCPSPNARDISFGKDEGGAPPAKHGSKRSRSCDLVQVPRTRPRKQTAFGADNGRPAPGETVLDRVHQAMICSPPAAARR